MPPARPQPTEHTAAASPWSENTRGIVSVLLVGHLTALALIFWANNDYDPGRTAPALDKTKQAFNTYLFPLWMDRKWDNKIANGEDYDSDHYLRLVAKNADGKLTEVARFPKAEGNLPEERERWQQFANDIVRAEEFGDGDTSGNDERLKQLAVSWLAGQREAGNAYDAVTIEVRRRLRIQLNGDRTRDPYHPDFNPAPPYGDASRRVLYPIEVIWPNGEGEPILRKLGGDKRDEAPVVPSSKSP